jgi:hypothetical protein
VTGGDPESLLAELERARQAFADAERRVRTSLVERGVLDQTSQGLRALVREAAEQDQRAETRSRASSST